MMKSSLTIHADFEAGSPVIKFLYTPSDDIRDDLMKGFFQDLGGDSNWLRFDFQPTITQSKQVLATITPIKPKDLLKESSKMNEMGIRERV